jgi:hypothetical protein
MTDNIGPPVSGINRAYSNTGGIGPQDGDILISLKEDHGATDDYVRQLRADLPKRFRARSSRSCRPISSARS